MEVKYDHSFDPNFEGRQMCVKNVMALPIHLIPGKEGGKCDLKVIPQYCIAHLYCALFSRHQRVLVQNMADLP